MSVKDDRVQKLLSKLTGTDFDRVFAPRAEPLAVPHYKLMTLEQLKQVRGQMHIWMVYCSISDNT